MEDTIDIIIFFFFYILLSISVNGNSLSFGSSKINASLFLSIFTIIKIIMLTFFINYIIDYEKK